MTAMLVSACAQSPAPSLSPAPSGRSARGTINPANIRRVIRELPSGYEVTSSVPNAASPVVIWGLGADPAEIRAQPPPCKRLADPGNGRNQYAQGVSGSGVGGIINAVVVAFTSGSATLDHNVVAACRRWTLSTPRATARVKLTEAPRIDGVETVGLVADIRMSVEAGIEIVSRAHTFIAYLGDYYAFTTLITDPGSAFPPLKPRFAADLLVETVPTLRS